MRKYQKILILFLLLIYLGNCFCGCESITGPNGIFKSPAIRKKKTVQGKNYCMSNMGYRILMRVATVFAILLITAVAVLVEICF